MDGKFGSSKHSDLKLVLSAIRRAIPELHGVMIASQDGLAIAHDFPEADAERIAAMAATALGIGKRISETCRSPSSMAGTDTWSSTGPARTQYW